LAEGEVFGALIRIDRAGDGTIRVTINGQGVKPRDEGVQAIIDRVLAAADGSDERQFAFVDLYAASVQHG